MKRNHRIEISARIHLKNWEIKLLDEKSGRGVHASYQNIASFDHREKALFLEVLVFQFSIDFPIFWCHSKSKRHHACMILLNVLCQMIFFSRKRAVHILRIRKTIFLQLPHIATLSCRGKVSRNFAPSFWKIRSGLRVDVSHYCGRNVSACFRNQCKRKPELF